MDPNFDVPYFTEDRLSSMNEEYLSMVRNKQKCQNQPKIAQVPIYKYLLEKEAKYGCSGRWLENRTDVGEQDRTSVIRWMVAVHRDLSVELYSRGYDITSNSLFLAIMYFDRALKMDFFIPILYMQCMASASLALGIKVDSRISTTSILYNFNKANRFFSKSLMTGAEQKICQDHNWELMLVTPNDALSYYIDRLKLDDQQIVIMMTEYLIEIGYHFSDVALNEYPSAMAAGALYCSIIGFGLLDCWHSDYQLLTGYSRATIERLGQRYAEMHLIAAQSFQCNASFVKYAIPEMKYVAIIDIGRRWRNNKPVMTFDNPYSSDD